MRLEVDGTAYNDWAFSSIESSEASIAKTFVFSGFNRFATGQINVGDECSVALEDVTIASGQIDAIVVDLRENITVYGSDRTTSLIKSNAAGSLAFTNSSVLQIISQLCSPFDISVSGVTGPTVTRFRINLNETVFGAIRRLSQTYNVIPTAGLDGNLILIDPTAFPDSGFVFREGINISEGVLKADDTSRYSQVSAYGQRKAVTQSSSVLSGVTTRTRVRNVLLDGEVDAATCELAATRLLDYLEGGATRVQLKAASSEFATAAQLVSVVSPTLGVSGAMLVERATFRMQGGEAKTEYSLVDPRMYGGTPNATTWLA